MGLADAFVTGGGYKYCQLGEGNCFLRVPPDRRMRPVLTGWFAEFAALEQSHAAGRVAYGPGASAFAGATYDPTSHYRGAAVFDFHARHGLTVDRLREINQRQIALLIAEIERLDLPQGIAAIQPLSRDRRGGFLAIRARRAVDIARAMRRQRVFADARGDILRLGPAPYVADEQLRDAAAALGEVARRL
jgi:kynureninase